MYLVSAYVIVCYWVKCLGQPDINLLCGIESISIELDAFHA
jgi:hypothetical protein